MKRLPAALLILIISVISFNCQKDLSFTGSGLPNNDNNIKSPVTATLQGNILDESGQPAAGVQISVGLKNTVTNSSGYFRIVDASLDKNASLVIAEKQGYFKAFRTFNATSGVNQVVIKLIKKDMAGTIDAESGGEITLSNGAKISLPAKGVIKESNGAPYTGGINVYTSYINPKSPDINQTIPGSFMANDKNNKRVSLISYGMVAVVLESTSGEKLQIAKDSKAKLTIPIPSSLQSSAPTVISLWYIDEQTGLWKEEGTAAKNGANYEGEVKHFSFWNADFGGPAVYVSMTLKDQSGHPLVYTNVSIITNNGINDTSGVAHGWTDSLGQVSGLVPANRNLILQIGDQCGIAVYSQNIGPFSQNTNLGTITIANTSPSIVTIHGKLSDCNNTPVSNGYAIISYDNFIRYETADDNGNFSTTFVTCSALQASCEIIGINNGAQQQGQAVNVSITSSETDAGNILACGISSSEFIQYNLDGTDYSFSPPKDSAFAYSSAYNSGYILYVSGADITKYINLNFINNGTIGTYPLTSLAVNNFSNMALVNPLNVIVTNYAQNAGEFYEGNFSGQFRDSSNLVPLHNISCSFRLRKY